MLKQRHLGRVAGRVAPRWMLAAVAALTMLTAGCAQDGATTLISTTPEAAGDQCPYGGLRFDTGLDADRNGILTGAEVDETAYVCNQRVDGRSTAVRVLAIMPGPECAAGGQRIEAGFDGNEDGTLSDGEVSSTALVCDGVAGEDGMTTRVRLVDIPAGGTDGACAYGGTRIESGPDTNDNGELDSDEVDSVQSVCSVEVASDGYLVSSRLEQPGERCPEGGTVMTFGFDDDDDGELDAAERDGDPIYLCNEVILVAGKTSLAVQQEATPAQCTFGGFVYRSGLDDDYDGTLSSDEVESVAVVCNGANGYTALVEQNDAGGACGDAGGYRVRSGLDLDDDGVLTAGEVTANNLLCHGEAVYGLDGRDSLASHGAVSYSEFCEGPATTLSTGLDLNANGVLDAGEVERTSYICDGRDGVDGVDGFDGYSALVEVYPATIFECPEGGLLVWMGTDYDDNGVLDYGEYAESLICP